MPLPELLFRTEPSVTDRYLRPPREDLRRALADLEEVVFGTANVVVLPKQAAG